MWLLIPILLYTVVYLFVRHVYSYWERKGFPTERAGLNWRFLKQVYQREFQHVDAVSEAYRVAGERDQIFGIYFFFRPALLVRDVKLARTILENSSGHFNDTKWDHVKGYRKINLLEKMAPMFAVSRVEGMFRNIEKVADYMVRSLKAQMGEAESFVEVDMQDVLRTYSINIIGNLVYGLDGNHFEQTDCIFSNCLKNSLRNRNINSFTLNHLPKKSSLTYRLRDIIRESVESREDGGVIRKDILQLLVKFRNGNSIGNGAKQSWHIENVFERDKVLSIKKLSKVAEAFLNMGLETTVSTAVLTLYEVLQEPLILQKLLEEIKCMKESNNVENKPLTYADLDGMKYLDICIKETLRKYPGVPIIERVCSKSFTIPGRRYTIGEGKTIMIPLMALQRDEKYFEDPLKYKPERFLENDNQEGYLGYGLGAEACVAQNFSKIVIKLAVVKLLQHFNVTSIESKNLKISHHPAPVIKEGFKVHVKCQEIKPIFYL